MFRELARLRLAAKMVVLLCREAREGVMPVVVPDLEYSFTARTLERGRAYFRSGAVVECREDYAGKTLILQGLVSGSRRKPYDVMVAVEKDGSVDAECSCPVGWQCKHAAALILKYINDSASAETVGSTAAEGTTVSLYAPDSPPSPLPGGIIEGIDMLARLRANNGTARTSARPVTSKQVVFYELCGTWQGKLSCEIYVCNVLKSGALGAAQRSDLWAIARSRVAAAGDVALCHMWLSNVRSFSHISDLPEDPEIREVLVRRLIATGRCHWHALTNPALQEGAPLPGRMKWLEDQKGRLSLGIVADVEGTDAAAIQSAGGFYIDTSKWIIGPLRDDYPAEFKEHLALLPSIRPDQAPTISLLLKERGLADIVPLPTPASRIDVELVRGKPSLWLETRSQTSGGPLSIAVFSVDYDTPGEFGRPDTIVDEATGEQRIVVRRKDLAYEKECRGRLGNLGFANVPGNRLSTPGRGADYLAMASVAGWARFLADHEAELCEEGWDIKINPSFAHRLVEPDDEWEIDVEDEEDTGWWFQLRLGITVEGQRLSLLPLIAMALRGVNAMDPLSSLEALTFAGKFVVPMSDGRLVTLPLERVLPLIEVLIEYFDTEKNPKKERIPICTPILIALLEKIATGRGDFCSARKLRLLVDSLRNLGKRNADVDLRAFNASLREYQVQGLSWLQFLRELNIGGILADDMGLGKTIQTLAHICAEKAAGRLHMPFLVICPTSVLPNWAAEARRFCPGLDVLCHHGKERSANWTSMDKHDLVLTSYAILMRDARNFIKQSFHGLILDEAQAVKNPDTTIAKTVRALKGTHRVCLTGTPIQNHLGDLWSQFEFLMPGFLGDAATFKKVFRTPIEKGADLRRVRALTARVKPFVVRRVKEEVAAELPSKTTIIRTVELEGAQRDLYETVRLAMHRKVLEEIAMKGFSRSQIVILEALLRLRQVCCHPALVKFEAAKAVTESAKLDALTSMLSELLESGRRVLLFSQFTSMLDLIKLDLATLGIKYVELTGETENREDPVQRFQHGEVPLFLLSLKAGGTGLNLTAADTVIHYDPWWNPYVEDQATDRAHRIGQDKPVFVYKLIARGTIEDRMLELQKKKRDVAEAVLAGARDKGLKLTEADISMLFQPISALHASD